MNKYTCILYPYCPSNFYRFGRQMKKVINEIYDCLPEWNLIEMRVGNSSSFEGIIRRHSLNCFWPSIARKFPFFIVISL